MSASYIPDAAPTPATAARSEGGRGSADSHVAAYRPDIDGLRAVAVLSVVLYHLNGRLLPGGFLGVDIFFVISGYLITQIIYREITAGTFTIRKFYERRIRRIMPALLAVLFATILGSAAILLSGDLLSAAKSVFATLAFAANIFFWRESDYFSHAAEQKPFLHLWSLGVEEQFYIFFPLLLIFARRLSRTWTLALVLASLAASFALDIVMHKVGGSNPAFYLLPTRAWELAAGAALAIGKPGAPSRLLAQIFGIAGAAMIAVSLWLGHDIIFADLPVGMFAVLGAVCVMYAGAAPRTVIGQALSLPPLVGVGLISYSLYLWHWPILVLVKYRTLDEPGALLLGLAVVAMFAAAFLSWRFIEQPFRSRTMKAGRVIAYTLAGCAAVCAIAGAIIIGQGLPQRLPAPAAAINAAVSSHFRCPVSDYVTEGATRGCVMNLPSRRIEDADVALIGNSHALMYTPALADVLKAKGLHGVLLNANTCLPSVLINLDKGCMSQAGDYISVVSRAKARIVFIGLKWGLEKDETLIDSSGKTYGQVEGMVLGLSDTIARLQAAGKTVVLIGPIAQPGWDVPSLLGRSLAFNAPLNHPLQQSAAAFDARMAPAFAAFEPRRDIAFARVDRVLCQAQQCVYVQNGRSMFADEHHLSADALPLFTETLQKALDQAQALQAERGQVPRQAK